MDFVKKIGHNLAMQMRYKCVMSAFKVRLNSVYIAYKVRLGSVIIAL
jgi:hypothetical protein